MNLIDYIRRHIKWSRATFGRGKFTIRLVRHIRKELLEIEAAPTDLEEWIDVLILGLDGAWRAGYTAEEIAAMLEAKLKKNQSRVFLLPDDPNEPAEHDRSRDHLQ